MTLMNINSLYVKICIVIAIACTIALYTIADVSTNKEVYYDSLLTNYGELDDAFIKEGKENLNIQVDFKFNGFGNDHQTLFQTAPGVEGVRLELANVGAGLWGCYIPDEKDKNKIINFNEMTMPIKNIWHHLELIVNDKVFYLYLDGALVHKEDVKASKFNVEQVCVGNDIENKTEFNGEIKNFELKTSKYIRAFDRLLFFLGNVVIFLLLYFYNKRNKHFFQYTNIISTKNILGCFVGIISFGMIVYSTQKTIEQNVFYQLLFYESYVLIIYLLEKYIVMCANVYNKYILFYLAFFVFLKSFFVRYSIIGVLSDTFLIYAFFYFTILITSKIRGRKCLLLRAIYSLLASSLMTFLAMGAIYVRIVQKIENSNSLFGEELQAVFQTNTQEAFEFLFSVFQIQYLAVLMLVFITISLVCWNALKVDNLSLPIKKKILLSSLMILLAALSIAIGGVGQSLLSPVYQLYEGYKQNIESMKHFQELRKQNQSIVANKNGKGETYVLVIGEAGNRRHYGAYGYFRDTTPWMSSLRQDSNTIFLENTYASFCHTVPSLLNALTSANQYNKEMNFAAPSIIEAAKAAGFRTYWFSNQNRYGLGDNPLTVVAEEADEVHFAANTNMGLDEELDKLLDKYLNNIDPEQNNLIIIHLLGSHAKYTSRLPEDYDTSWKESGVAYLGDVSKDEKFVNDVLNPYDSTIRYTDNNLQKMYQTIKAKVPDLSAYIYMPDHGEDVYGQKFHDSSQFTWEMVRVPFMMMVSDKWKQQYSGRFQLMQAHKDLPLTTDCLFNYMLGMMDIQSNIYEKQFDISSDSYDINWDNAITMWTDKNLQTQLYNKTNAIPLKDDPLYQKRTNIAWLNSNFKNKYLAVACDTVANAYEAIYEGASGMEINITPREDKIMMGHWPEYVLDLSFEEWLSIVPQERINKLWLDTKISSPELIQKTVDELDALDNKYNLKNRVIFESSMDDLNMKKFEEHGWNVMYYFLPTRNDVSGGVECPPSVMKLVENKTGQVAKYEPTVEELPQIKAYAKNVSSLINRQKVHSISFWAEGYPFIIGEILPNVSTSMGLATWSIPGFPRVSDKKFKDEFYANKYRNILGDPDVHTILYDAELLFGIRL